jgi:hypothetical protein
MPGEGMSASVCIGVSYAPNREFPANSLQVPCFRAKLVIFGQNSDVLAVADYYPLFFSLLLGFSLEAEPEMRSGLWHFKCRFLDTPARNSLFLSFALLVVF